MEVVNIHETDLEAAPAAIGRLIDSLASRHDQLWPVPLWPRMQFERALGRGAEGGHGPIRYYVEAYTPGISVKFRFTAPKGFEGFHGYERVEGANHFVLRHTLKMRVHGMAVLSWPLVYRPLHDALMEDSLTMAKVSLGLCAEIHHWSAWVKILRWIASAGKARPQRMPTRPTQR